MKKVIVGMLILVAMAAVEQHNHTTLAIEMAGVLLLVKAFINLMLRDHNPLA